MMIIIIIIIIVADCCVFFAKVCCLIFSCGDEKNTQQSTPVYRPIGSGGIGRFEMVGSSGRGGWKSSRFGDARPDGRAPPKRNPPIFPGVVGGGSWGLVVRIERQPAGVDCYVFFSHFLRHCCSLLFFIVVVFIFYGVKMTPHTLPAIPLLARVVLLGGEGRGPKTPPWFRPWRGGRSVGWLARLPPSRLEESPFWRRSACWQSAAKATPSSAPNAAMTPVSGCGGEWCGGEDRAAAAMVRGSVGCCIFCWLVFFVRARRPLLRERTCTCAPKSALCSTLQ